MFGKKTEAAVPTQLPGRNDPCHCGSKKKYKKCCEAKDEAKSHVETSKQWEKAEKDFEKLKKEAEQKAAEIAKTLPANAKPSDVINQMKQAKHSTMQVPKFNMPRKTGGG